MYATVLALHLTPSRRLKACLQKYKRCGREREIGIVSAVLSVLEGWSNGPHDLAQLCGAFMDEDQLMVTSNVDCLLKSLLKELSFSEDYRVREFVHKHECKYSLSTTYVADCHFVSKPTLRHEFIEASLHLKRAKEGGPDLDVQSLQKLIVETTSLSVREACQRFPRCEEIITKRLERKMAKELDPDFLTIYFSSPQTIRDIAEAPISFSNSQYLIKSLVHWDMKRLKASVSAERKSGWSWFGVDSEQAKECKYEKNLFLNVAAIMCVRTNSLQEEASSASENEKAHSELDQRLNTKVTSPPEVPNREENFEDSELAEEFTGTIVQEKDYEENDREEEWQSRTGVENGEGDPCISNMEEVGHELRFDKRGAEGHSQLDRDIERAKKASLKEAPLVAPATDIVNFGIRFAQEQLQLACTAHTEPIKPDGNCFWCCLCVSWDSSLTGKNLQDKAVELRQTAVLGAVQALEMMTEEQFEALLLSFEDDENKGREQLIKELITYMESGQWSGVYGDLLPQIGVTFLKQPVLLIEMSNSRTQYATFIMPAYPAFHNIEGPENVPAVLIRNGNHFEPILPSPESIGKLCEHSNKWVHGRVLTLGNCSMFEREQTNFIPVCASTPLKNKNRETEQGQQSRTGEREKREESTVSTKRTHGDVEQSILEDSLASRSVRQTLVTRCDRCKHEGHFANHLRNSEPCLNYYKSQTDFTMNCSDEEFIVKNTILIRDCPVPYCSSGSHHRSMPSPCLDWWREVGWQIVGFKGVTEDTPERIVRAKISNFVRQYKKRKGRSGGEEQSSRTSGAETERGQGNENEEQESQFQDRAEGVEVKNFFCQFCNSSERLGAHLTTSEECLNHFIRTHLPRRQNMYLGKLRMAVFDLSFLLGFCPNPLCTGIPVTDAFTKHVKIECIAFFQEQIPRVYVSWDQIRTPEEMVVKISRRRDYIKGVLRSEAQTGILMYRHHLSEVLTNICGECYMQGPSSPRGSKMVCIGRSEETGEALWRCSECVAPDHQMKLPIIMRKALELGGTGRDDTLQPVLIRDQRAETARVVYVPAFLAKPGTIVQEQDVPFNATVLVANLPEALDEFSEETMKKARQVHCDLREVTDFCSKRPLVIPAHIILTVAYRKLLADIDLERKQILSALCSTSKGSIVSRRTKSANIKDRNPHFNATKQLCLSNTCEWSDVSREQAHRESCAIQRSSGQVKTKVRIKVLNKLSLDDVEMQRIIFQTSLTHCPDGMIPLIATAPLCVTYVKAKVDLLLQHIISSASVEGKYNHWDLSVDFIERDWTVFLTGDLYSVTFEEINKKMARDGASLEERTHEVLRNAGDQPTVSLQSQSLQDQYAMSKERSDAVVALAKRVQVTASPQPLSLFLMISHSGVEAPQELMILRGRSVEIGQKYAAGDNTEGAIIEIAQVLKSEGLQEMPAGSELRTILENQYRGQCEGEELQLLEAYHYMIWQTGASGSQLCTLPRMCGETCVTPYIPAILEATQFSMQAEITVSGETEEFRGQNLKNDMATYLSEHQPDHQAEYPPWCEVSIIHFINSVFLKKDKDKRLTALRSRPTVNVVTSKDHLLSWRGATDQDDIKGEEIFSSTATEGKTYVRTDGDVRKLFENKPPWARNLLLGQFASEFRLIKPNQRGYDRVKSLINRETLVGPPSDKVMAGQQELLPQCLELTHGALMTRRQEKAVLVPLYQGTPTEYSSNLLWSPWTLLEDVVGDNEREEVETDQQKDSRLQVFPFSLIM